MNLIVILFCIALFMFAVQATVSAFRGFKKDNRKIVTSVGPENLEQTMLGETKDPKSPFNSRGLVAINGKFVPQSKLSTKTLRNFAK